MPDAELHVIRAELPTPDLVVVREPGGRVTIVADQRLPDVTVQRAMDEIEEIMMGQPYALG